MAQRAGAVTDQEQVRRLVFDTMAVRALAQVLELAREVGAIAAPIKGVVLARWLYDEILERPYRDLDLIVARAGLPRLAAAVEARGWPIQVQSAEMGELEFTIDHVTVEVHAEIGRRDLSRLATADVLARAVSDRTTFPFEILRIDEFDHFFLLIANVTKKAFTYANRHQPADLERLLGRLEPRWEVLITRAAAAGFVTAVRNVSTWMVEEHGSARFSAFARLLPDLRRRPLEAAVRLHRRLAEKQPNRLESTSGLLGLALATLTPDDRALQIKGLSRLLRRGLYRRLGGEPG
jgi:Uncharacterised nucleotidyltransferase